MTATQDTAVPGPARRDRTGMRALWGANWISTLGSLMSSLALPWFILETTGSAARTGLLATAITTGAVLSSVASGPMIDRLGFKRASVITDVVSALLVAAIPLLYRADLLEFWLILVLAFLLASMQYPGDAARYALVPGLAHRAAITIDRANAVDRALVRFSMLVGPLVAGILIAVLGPLNVLLIQAATFAASGVIVAALVRPGSRAGAVGPVEVGRSYRTEMLVGLRFVATNSLLLSVALVIALANGLDAALNTVVLPVYAQQIWGSPTSLGVLVSALGAGALIGTALFGALGHRLPRRITFLLGGAAGGLLLYGGLALTPPLGVMAVLVFLGGIIAGPIVPLAQTVVQTTTPEDMYGRVFGALQSTSMAVAPFATAIVGFVIQGAGLVPTIVALGALFLTLTLGMMLNPALRQMDADRTAGATVTTP